MRLQKRNRTSAPLLILAVILSATHALAAQTIQSFQEAGAHALAFGRYVDAIEAYGEALRINGNDLTSTIGMSEAYYGLEEYDEAHRYAERARVLAGPSPRVLTLSGRIAIGLGDLESAAALFHETQTIEPNNVDARLGLAELAIAEGRSLDAIQSLEGALRYRPDDRKALLSLALVHEAAGNVAAAERYLETALLLHGDRAETHILAAEFDLRQGRNDAAASRARTAQALDEHNLSATRIRTTVSLLDGRFLEAQISADEMIRRNRTDPVGWYMRGLAHRSLGDTDEAMTSFLTALRYRADIETIRLVAEDLALSAYPLDSPVRAQLAAHVEATASHYASEFRYSRALAEYRRALRLSPLDTEIRRSYAELLRTVGQPASYLQELEVIQETGDAQSDVEITISIYENLLSESPASRWNVDQFTVSRASSSVALYMLGSGAGLRFPLSQDAILSAIARHLSGQERIEVLDSGMHRSFTEAFSSARSQDVDFFILIDPDETERSFHISGGLYVGRTGTLVTDLSVARGGPDRVLSAVDSFVRRVQATLPLSALIISRTSDRVLLDVGVRDGIEVDQEFLVFGPGSVLSSANSARFIFSEEDSIGSARVTHLDDLVSEAALTTFGIVDSVVPGDAVYPSGESADQTREPPSYPLLYDRVRALR